MKYAALFGGSGNDRETKEYKETVLIGKLLHQYGYVVKNGGYGGMMEAVSKGVTSEGGKAIGITCRQVGTEKGNSFLTNTIVTQKLYERLQFLIDNTGLFIVQKGGIGTLSEVFLTLDIIRKNSKTSQPKMYFIGEFWNEIIDTLKTTIIPKHEHYLFSIVENVEELEQKMIIFE